MSHSSLGATRRIWKLCGGALRQYRVMSQCGRAPWPFSKQDSGFDVQGDSQPAGTAGDPEPVNREPQTPKPQECKGSDDRTPLYKVVLSQVARMAGRIVMVGVSASIHNCITSRACTLSFQPFARGLKEHAPLRLGILALRDSEEHIARGPETPIDRKLAGNCSKLLCQSGVWMP